MSELEDTPIVASDLPMAGERALSGPESLREGLRRQRDEAMEMRPLELPLPEYKNPELIAQYQLIDPTELNRIAERVRNEFKTPYERSLYGAIDSMCFACQGLFARYPGDKDLIPLDPEVPMIYDTRLADYMELEANTAREVVIQLFGNNIFAIVEHNLKISRWMGDRKSDLSSGLGDM